MRILLIVLTLGLFPANTWAQARESLPSWSVAHRDGSPAEGWPIDPLPQFSVPPLTGRAVPLPQIGLPLPPIGLRPPKTEEGNPYRSPWPARFASWPYMVVVPGFAPAVTPAGVSQAPPIVAAKGSLILGVQPATTQVFVDGFYVGAAEDFAGERGGAFLEAGPHVIELMAPGYEPVSFDVKIAPNESMVYRRELKSIETQAPTPVAPPVATTPTTIYMIPGCYVGNVPPKDASLPPACDPVRALKFVM